MSEDHVSPEVVDRRVRNRIIEHLEVASSFVEQREYQTRVSFISVPNELINQWEDWFVASEFDRYGPPAYTHEERTALMRFHLIWEAVADSTPNPLPDLEATLRLPEWVRLRKAAEEALEVFQQRGKLPED